MLVFRHGENPYTKGVSDLILQNRDDTIKSYMGYAYRICQKYNSDEDSYGVAFTELVACVDRAMSMTFTDESHFKNYIGRCIRGVVEKYITENHTIKRSQNYDTEPIPKISLDEELPFFSDRVAGTYHDIIPCTNQALYNLLKDELLNSASFDSREKRIMAMRIEGYTDAEIGKELGLTQASICLTRKSMEARVRRIIS